MAEAMGSMNTEMSTAKATEVASTMQSVVAYTFLGCSPSLLMKRKNVVSIPYVSRMINSET